MYMSALINLIVQQCRIKISQYLITLGPYQVRPRKLNQNLAHARMPQERKLNQNLAHTRMLPASHYIQAPSAAP